MTMSEETGASADAPAADPGDQSRATTAWAGKVERLTGAGLPAGAPAFNLEGRRLTGPLQGFGKMWDKRYRVTLGGAATPTEVIKVWKERYPDFWPQKAKFYAPVTGISPGEVGAIKTTTGPMRLSTGIMVLYADDESFTFMTPEGHPFAGWITFSAADGDDGCVAEAHLQIRASDLLYEIGFALGGSRVEDRMWQHTLRALAAHFGVDAEVETVIECVDPTRRWRRLGGIRHNAALRSVVRPIGAPVRWVRSGRRGTPRVP